MTKRSKNSEKNRAKAAELYERALKLEAQRDYNGAIESYVQSLELYEDPVVEAAYFKLLSMVGPK